MGCSMCDRERGEKETTCHEPGGQSRSLASCVRNAALNSAGVNLHTTLINTARSTQAEGLGLRTTCWYSERLGLGISAARFEVHRFITC